ncbi:hypothetical protein O181_012154 [Austropuccinia psidii MF-1]|uniref:Uncharacterized protein n=1 Tax=Austropuccinia psidii MF-1 TaxID=1389203 RepID=A0A9Q3BU57_9BASI|nr:hypothetical protein [Austropuccinia psidii MF-1]
MPPLPRDHLFPRNQPENWPTRNRGRRQPITRPNDTERTYQQGTPSQSPIQYQIQPRNPTRGLERCRISHTNSQTPEIPLYMEDGQQNLQYGSMKGQSGNNCHRGSSKLRGHGTQYSGTHL